MVRLNRAQRVALKRVYDRTVHENQTCDTRSYRTFRRGVEHGPGCVMVRFAGMWLGIEPDGYTHS